LTGPIFDDPTSLRRHLRASREADAIGELFAAVDVGKHDIYHRY
jgi:hypothetical protein